MHFSHITRSHSRRQGTEKSLFENKIILSCMRKKITEHDMNIRITCKFQLKFFDRRRCDIDDRHMMKTLLQQILRLIRISTSWY